VPQEPGAQPLATKLGINQESCSTERRRDPSARLFPQDADPGRIVNLSKSERGELAKNAGKMPALQRGSKAAAGSRRAGRCSIPEPRLSLGGAITGVVKKTKYTEG